MTGCLDWLRNPVAKASAHYLIDRTGKIYQLVKEGDTAWHAGNVSNPNWPLYDGSNPNRYTIGIEHEGQPGDGLTEAQFQATLWLQTELAKKYNLPADSNHFIGHYRIDSVNRPNCPGPKFPWERLISGIYNNLKNGGTKTVSKTLVDIGKNEVPTGPNITPLNGGTGWIESLPERVIIHFSKYSYISIWNDKITANVNGKETVNLA
jgi:N-acetyl-anhydromuramyl-L-alanine amidase AmpD